MNYFVRRLFTIILMVSTIFSPLTFAQTSGDVGTGDDTTTVIEEVEKESCVLPWADYQAFINNKLAYQAAVVDDDYTTAQEVFELMQDSLVANCGTTASIVDVQAAELDEACLLLVNHLVAKNNFYVRESQVNDAIDTQAVIQTILSDMSCEPVLAGDAQEAVAEVIQDISENQIDPALSVIPFEENACFMTYGPSQTFTQQINRLDNLTVLDSVYATVNTYMAGLQGLVADETKRLERESTLLQFADTVVQNKRLQWLFGNNQEPATLFSDQLASALESVNAILANQGRDTLVTWLGNDPVLITDYVAALTQLPLRDTYVDKQAIFDDIAVTPHTFVWDTQLADFQEVVTDESSRGFSFIVPGLDEQDITVRFLEFDATVIPVGETNTAGEIVEGDDEIEFNHLVIDVYQGDEKLAAADISIEYAATGQVMDFAIYTKPYILTNHIVVATDPDTGVENLSMQINAYGPAGCDTVIYFDQEVIPGETLADGTATDEVQNVDFSITIGKATLTASIADSDTFFDEISAHRQIVPEATSAPQTAAHVIEAKIYHDGTYIADIYPANNTRRIRFTNDPDVTYNLMTVYLNPLLEVNPISIDSTIGVIMSLMALYQNEPVEDTTKDPVSYTYLTECIDGSGSTVDGYYYYADQDAMVSTYCLDTYDSCGDYNYTAVDGLDLYFRASGQDPVCSNLTPNTPDPVYGCTDKRATNHDPVATQDDGTCSYDATGSGDTAGSGDTTPDPEVGSGDTSGSGDTTPTPDPVYGCTDETATNHNPDATDDDGTCTYPQAGPVVGCPDETALNYVQGADDTDESNWALCEYPMR